MFSLASSATISPIAGPAQYNSTSTLKPCTPPVHCPHGQISPLAVAVLTFEPSQGAHLRLDRACWLRVSADLFDPCSSPSSAWPPWCSGSPSRHRWCCCFRVQELTVFYIPGLALFNIFRRYVLQLAGQGNYGDWWCDCLLGNRIFPFYRLEIGSSISIVRSIIHL